MFTVMGFRDWLAAQSYASTTIKQRVWFAESRVADWGTVDVPAHVIGDWLREFSGYTQRTYLTHLKSLYAYALEVGLVAVNPLVRLKADPRPEPHPSPLSADELAAVFSHASGDLRTWLLLGFLAGLRCHEMAKVRGEDVTEMSLTVFGKGRRTHTLPLHRTLWTVAQSYPRVGFWFPSPQARREYVCTSHVENRIRAHFRSVGIESGAGHRLRHSYASALARSGTHMRVVQTLMRHVDLSTTMAYVAVDDDEKRAALASLAVA